MMMIGSIRYSMVVTSLVLMIICLKDTCTAAIELPAYDDGYVLPSPHSLTLSEFNIRTANFTTTMHIFYKLPPPTNLQAGEYLADLLDAGSNMNNVLGYTGFYNPILPGYWVGKAFVTDQGYGYNMFMENGCLVRKYKFAAQYTKSVWDPKLTYELDYRHETHYLGRMQMRDELREIRPGVYLGLGAFGFREARSMQPMPFLLRGPFNPPQPQEITD